MNNEELKSNLLSSKHWLRLVFILLFAVLLYLASIVISVLVVLQFLFSLVTGQDNINIRQFGSSLSTYIYQTLKFLTYNSEEKPFPFADWPDAVDQVAPVAEAATVVNSEPLVSETANSEPAVKKPRARKTAPKETDDSEGGV
jgi:hypothetical protein